MTSRETVIDEMIEIIEDTEVDHRATREVDVTETAVGEGMMVGITEVVGRIGMLRGDKVELEVRMQSLICGWHIDLELTMGKIIGMTEILGERIADREVRVPCTMYLKPPDSILTKRKIVLETREINRVNDQDRGIGKRIHGW